MVASGKDRAHFRAIAEATAAGEADAIDRILALTPGERLVASLELLSDQPWTPAQLAQIDADADGQMELARRRIALGLATKSPP